MLLLLAFATTESRAAMSPDEQLADPVLEQRARVLGRELRCLVCQNQSIDDSDADLAKDLRQIVRERLVAGDSDTEILDYLQARYGEFVLLRPPVSSATWLLWSGPFILLLVAGTAAFLWRRRSGAPKDEAWTPDEQRQLEAALGRDDGAAGSPGTR
ncbi:MAG TPA: cytochrome c-type biogenesis protein [Geminicoccus sp.]|uniref:cytochrome c-type biogenesis protein n=1 Tax=Geminicoccus sp. TaxID=2024832 RepID=UPI002E331542|nr:cytochrome c-type biogenesis protein [Geminicoccus sp.]HEX2526507.1 cytochrome c-type biogenesis protein [Geminicoccus sp.]